MINSVVGVKSVGSTNSEFTFGQSQDTQTNDGTVDNHSNNVDASQAESNTTQAADILELGFGIKKTDEKKLEDRYADKKKDKDLSKEDVSAITETLNKLMENMNVDVKFKYYEKLDRLTVQIMEKNSDKVLKEFPPKEMIKVLTGIHDWIGLILDKKA